MPLIYFNLHKLRFLLQRLLKRRGRTYRTGRLMPPCMHSDPFVAP